jgi:hypothetical protein
MHEEELLKVIADAGVGSRTRKKLLGAFHNPGGKAKKSRARGHGSASPDRTSPPRF